MQLAELTQLAAATLPFAEKMDRMACLVRDTLQACLCVIYLFESEEVRVWLSNHPPRDLPDQMVAERLALEQWHRTGLVPISRRPSPQPNGARAACYAPIVQGTTFLGLLSCSFDQPSPETPEERELLRGIAHLIALAWRAEHLERRLSQQPMSPQALIAALREGSADLAMLPARLSQPHVVAALLLGPSSNMVESWRADASVADLLQQRFQEQFPDTLLALQGKRATALIPLRGVSIPGVRTHLSELAQVAREHLPQVRLSIGLSNPCLNIQAYATGLREAEEALAVGRHLPGCPPIIHVSELGLARYLARLARDPLPTDPMQDQLHRLAQYDEQRAGSHLLDTLEVYLDCWGNIAQAAQHLGLHRNTVIQRMERLQEVLHVDLLHASECWLPWHLALKLFHLRQRDSAE